MPLLAVDDVSVRFGGKTALEGVALAAEAGQVTALIGPNGAGKTTLFNVITGLQPPTRGRILVDGRDVSSMAPHRRARLGVARTFQRLELFRVLTVRENVMVAAEAGERGWARRLWDLVTADPEPADPSDFGASAPRPTERLEASVDALIRRVGLIDVADARVDALPTGQARLVELARALATRPRLLLLDEPASGLDDGETDTFGRLLRSLAGDGVGVLLVEHDMGLVMEASDVVHVLDFGRIIATGSPGEVRADPAVLEAYLGTGAGAGTGPGVAS